ncbi:MAG: DUF1385 domain-containing protein [Oscillospiraceae bacterium]|jgi:uncharacterized protein YqhQ|nr:DUF1385 domain-containing protein [Oscillospiraceae bacterium]
MNEELKDGITIKETDETSVVPPVTQTEEQFVSAEETPVVEETSVAEDTPAEETPVAETPAEELPAEETPAEEETSSDDDLPEPVVWVDYDEVEEIDYSNYDERGIAIEKEEPVVAAPEETFAEEDNSTAAKIARINKNRRAGENKITSIGGQALIEGVMMKGPNGIAMAVRNSKGEIQIEEVPDKSNKKVRKIPFVRGVYGFFEAMSSGMKTLTRSAEIAGMEEEEEDETKKSGKFGQWLFNFAMGIAMILGIALAVLLFFFVPAWLYGWIHDLMTTYTPDSDLYNTLFVSDYANLIRSAFEGVLKITVFVLYIALVSQMKDIKRVFSYHGAEHKTIFCYERGAELSVENVRRMSRFHPRCGTSFLIIMLILGVIVGMFIQYDEAWIRAIIRIACIPVIMGVGYELLKLCGRYNNFLTRIISAPGMWMQRLTTREPDDSMIECAIAALAEVAPENGEDDRW